MNGIDRIAAERRRHVEQEGWTPEHDAQHGYGELAVAAACYAAYGQTLAHDPVTVIVTRENHDRASRWVRDAWPWSQEWDKRGRHDRLRQLEIAGALIAAEIDRLLAAE